MQRLAAWTDGVRTKTNRAVWFELLIVPYFAGMRRLEHGNLGKGVDALMHLAETIGYCFSCKPCFKATMRSSVEPCSCLLKAALLFVCRRVHLVGGRRKETANHKYHEGTRSVWK